MHLLSSLAVIAFILLPGSAAAFERDVHFGLTKWLALQTGFTLQQADAIAVGNQRVDSGDMPYIELVSTYACLGKDAEGAADAGRHHYPTNAKLPAPPEQRAVTAGGEAVRQRTTTATKVSDKQAGFLLYKLGDAIHALQDSWSHQGVPDVPRVLEGLVTCNPQLAWGHPRARGGWNSHKADLTHQWPGDTLAMAKATYDVLREYQLIGGEKREPKEWPAIRPMVESFTKAATKTDKKKWFVGQGIADVTFLEGISLPDGAEPFKEVWPSHKLPPLLKVQSTQHHVDGKLLDFFTQFFTKWLSNDDFDALAAEFGVDAAPAPGAKGVSKAAPKADAGGAAKGGAATVTMDKAELAARLMVWRILDHGRVTDIAHSPSPLTAQQRAQLASIAKNKEALAKIAELNEAFFPLLVKGPEPSPLLGFVIHQTAKSAAGNERVVATTKFRHVPYDTMLVVAERIDGNWRIISLGATVDH